MRVHRARDRCALDLAYSSSVFDLDFVRVLSMGVVLRYRDVRDLRVRGIMDDRGSCAARCAAPSF